MLGKMVKSKAGHDKDNIYFVIGLDEKKEFAYLADGKFKTIAKPKKKNIKHLQIINKETELGQKIIASEKYIDEEIKRAIKLFNN